MHVLLYPLLRQAKLSYVFGFSTDLSCYDRDVTFAIKLFINYINSERHGGRAPDWNIPNVHSHNFKAHSTHVRAETD